MIKNLIIGALALSSLYLFFWGGTLRPGRDLGVTGVAFATYENCTHGGHDCYYSPGKAPGVIGDLAQIDLPAIERECFKNTTDMKMTNREGGVDIVFRCSTEAYIGEYDVIIASDDEAHAYITSYAFATNAASQSALGTIVDIGAGIGI